VRGIAVLALTPSEYLTENEIAAAAVANQGGAFNPQQQFKVTWPAEPVVARAYVDQLERSDSLSSSFVAGLTTALASSESKLQDGARDKSLANELDSFAADLSADSDDSMTGKRQISLAETLTGIAVRLR
jgi:hypothetical protein